MGGVIAALAGRDVESEDVPRFYRHHHLLPFGHGLHFMHQALFGRSVYFAYFVDPFSLFEQ